MKLKILLFLTLSYFASCDPVFAQKTYVIDTVSQKGTLILTNSPLAVKFYTSSTSRIRQRNDSTFYNTYSNNCPYIISVYIETGLQRDSCYDHISLWKNGSHFTELNKLADSLNNDMTFTTIISMNMNDSLQFKCHYLSHSLRSVSDTIKTFDVKFLRFP